MTKPYSANAYFGAKRRSLILWLLVVLFGLATLVYVVAAVMNRKQGGSLAVGIILLLFVVVGVWRIHVNRRLLQKLPVAQWRPLALRRAADFAALSVDRRELKSPYPRLVNFVWMAIFAAGCDFTVWKGVELLVPSWRGSEPDWGYAIMAPLFGTPAVYVTNLAIRRFMGLFNPVPHFVVSPGLVALGETFSLEWTMKGRVSKLTRLRIMFEGREVTEKPAGDSNEEKKRVFYCATLLDSTEKAGFAHGKLSIPVPHHAMHSLDTGHNKINWVIRIEGTIPCWAGMQDEYPLLVLPVRKEAAS